MGLNEILDELHKDSDAENNEILEHAKMVADKIIVDKVEELSSYYKKQRSALEAELKRLNAKLLAKAELDAHREKQRI